MPDDSTRTCAQQGGQVGRRQVARGWLAAGVHVIEAVLRRERRERREQVLAQRAADAAIRELDHLLLLLQHPSTPHKFSVDVHRRHVVDDYRDAAALAIVQHVVEQSRFAGAKKAGEHCHRQWAPGASLAQEEPRLPHCRVWRRNVCHRLDVAPDEHDGCGTGGRLEVGRLDVDTG
jgi:hypothetical protein